MYSGSKGKSELFGGGLASYETIKVMQREAMRASGMPRRAVEGLRWEQEDQLAWDNHERLPREPDPEALTYILLLVLTQGIKLALNCIVYDISKY